MCGTVSAYRVSGQLSIYPEPEAAVTLVPTQTELERQIGSARRRVDSLTQSARSSLTSSVNSWIGVEKRIEARVKSLIPADEPLTPGLLYVGVATLAGSVFTRFRKSSPPHLLCCTLTDGVRNLGAFPIRFLTPPLLAVASLNYFNPKLATNVGEYYTSIEQAHLPALTEQRQALFQQASKAWKSAEQSVEHAKSSAEHGLKSGLDSVEKSTGLKVANVVGNAKDKVDAQLKAV